MAKALSNINVLNAKFNVADFTGAWLASIGKPELCGAWIIYGKSGSGKTTFALQLCKYLSDFDRTAYNSLEQGLSLSFQTAWRRVDMEEAGTQIVFLDKEPIDELRIRLGKRKSPNIVIIDSLTCMVGFSKREFVRLLSDFPSKLFIFLAHEKNGMPDPSIAEMVRRLSDVKMRVEGYKAFITTRYENSAKNEGGADFTIWEQGAIEYWAENL